MGSRALALALLLNTSCGAAVFACDEDTDCAGGSGGLCEGNGYCSFPDDACASGRRYGDKGPAGIAGTCVPVGEETGDGSSSTSSSTTGVASTSTSSTATTQSIDDSGSSSSTTTGKESTSSSTSGSSSSSEPFVVEVAATIAVCTEPGLFDPEHCAAEAGDDQLTLDAEDVDGNISNGWVRFDLEGALEGAEVLTAQLVLRVGPEDNDDSDQSGEVWLAEEFDGDSLTMEDPALLELVAEDLGPVEIDAEVVFDLPTDIFTTDAMCFGLIATTDDGLDYMGHASTMPPRLLITAQ